jgi:hypothetical protein
LKNNIFRVLFLFALIRAAAAPAAEKTGEPVAPGLRHLVKARGETATAPTFRILIGEYDSQSEADQMLDRLTADGFPVALDADSKRYRIVIPGLTKDSEAEDLRRQLLQRGYAPPLEIQKTLDDLTHPDGPWRINVLEADPKLIEVQVAHAYDAAIGLETTADLAERHGALAAVNGGFFLMTGLLAGDSQGTLVMDGTLLSEPDRGRAAVGFYSANGATRAVVGRLSFRGEIRFGDGAAVPIDGINRSRGASEIILYTPEFHRTTLTPPGGAEIIVENGRITKVRDGHGRFHRRRTIRADPAARAPRRAGGGRHEAHLVAAGPRGRVGTGRGHRQRRAPPAVEGATDRRTGEGVDLQGILPRQASADRSGRPRRWNAGLCHGGWAATGDQRRHVDPGAHGSHARARMRLGRQPRRRRIHHDGHRRAGREQPVGFVAAA